MGGGGGQAGVSVTAKKSFFLDALLLSNPLSIPSRPPPPFVRFRLDSFLNVSIAHARPCAPPSVRFRLYFARSTYPYKRTSGRWGPVYVALFVCVTTLFRPPPPSEPGQDSGANYARKNIYQHNRYCYYCGGHFKIPLDYERAHSVFRPKVHTRSRCTERAARSYAKNVNGNCKCFLQKRTAFRCCLNSIEFASQRPSF